MALAAAFPGGWAGVSAGKAANLKSRTGEGVTVGGLEVVPKSYAFGNKITHFQILNR